MGDMIFDYPNVSRLHAMLIFRDDHWFIVDLEVNRSEKLMDKFLLIFVGF